MAYYNGPFYCIQRLHRLLVAYTSSMPNDEQTPHRLLAIQSVITQQLTLSV